ncbi:MauE/DoxX family redox-associated membrane protein [Algoriphagus terrigena]|uniref:MauE/DoxX family redox-associated membrane protein n=1 Tax=Algoriphagus terrigena TaxID=344884 RepID=UPI000413E5E3|nr:MauE/DoxX family redox-associated membrane protein [Algoriphagus terrigena]
MKTILSIPTAALILLWTYTGLDKIVRFEDSRKAFHNQTFPAELAEILSYAVPAAELLIVVVMLFSMTRWWGMLGSLLLLTVFTTYVGLIWVEAFPRIPCNCAGILESLGWAEHFWMNLFFIGISVFGLYKDKAKKPKTGSSALGC